ncbi:MAG: hypothetical protein JNK04_20245, partial [Myxococcales bacterium]|nr:hypothetical protein [Myxococcales bacterium]
MRFASRATIVALGFGWALLLATNGAFAQGPADGDGKVVAAREAARALALKALAKIDSGQVAEGIALLEQAEASFHAPTHLLYLAQAHASMGHAARAAQTYDTLVREELPNYAPDEFREAERIGRVELRAVESKVGRIKLVLIGAPDGAKPTVRLDGASVPIAADVLYAEPGPREVEVTIGEQTRKARVTARAGQEDSLLFEVGAVEPRVRQGDVG